MWFKFVSQFFCTSIETEWVTILVLWAAYTLQGYTDESYTCLLLYFTKHCEVNEPAFLGFCLPFSNTGFQLEYDAVELFGWGNSVLLFQLYCVHDSIKEGTNTSICRHTYMHNKVWLMTSALKGNEQNLQSWKTIHKSRAWFMVTRVPRSSVVDDLDRYLRRLPLVAGLSAHPVVELLRRRLGRVAAHVLGGQNAVRLLLQVHWPIPEVVLCNTSPEEIHTWRLSIETLVVAFYICEVQNLYVWRTMSCAVFHACNFAQNVGSCEMAFKHQFCGLSIWGFPLWTDG